MMLSRVGKEILIKVVAQSILTYTMSVFQLPMKLCDELDNLCAKFWWGQVGNERKIHWKNWDKLSTSKREGGMGFRDLIDFNLAMLPKQGWRMIQDRDSLLLKCFKARYFPQSFFLRQKSLLDVLMYGEVWWLHFLFLNRAIVGGLVMGLQ